MTNGGVDNYFITDANSNVHKERAKDVSGSGDGSLQFKRQLESLHSVDIGYAGSLVYTAKSGVMAAGLAAGSDIFSLINFAIGGTIECLVRRMTFNAWTTSGAGFAAGLATFDLFFARSYNVEDTGQNHASLGPYSMLATYMTVPGASIDYSNTGALTVGTYTLDLAPIASLNSSAPSTPLTKFYGNNNAGVTLFEKRSGDHPILLKSFEGVIVRATVPATGTWSFALTTESDVLPNLNF